jgi:hypothetical protein
MSTGTMRSPDARDMLFAALEARFAQHAARHTGLTWAAVRERLEAAPPEKAWSLGEMERTGGEPDVFGRDDATGAFLFCDCAPESPAGRRSLCFDAAALAARKTAKPAHSAAGLAAEMGVSLMTETEYRALQRLGEFDLKTSSWIETPADIRAKGGALFCDRRYGHVFVYHNGAESYYAARGFRAILRV